jgi:CspA family cold shock protein
MTITGRIIIALAVAAAVATATTYFQSPGSWFDPILFAALCVATVATVLLSSMGGQAAAGHHPVLEDRQQAAPSSTTGAAATDAGRENGQVKWFNVSKGFGFITKDDGEEIFVHFRSIRGEGRRSLRDGQRVSFIVAQSDKGPQAEDVVAI